jgi:hypothetical protein
MKNKFRVLVVLTALFVNDANSQIAPSIKFDSLYKSGKNSDADITLNNKVFNKSASNQTFKWVIITTSIPSGWSYDLCDPNTCISDPDSSTFDLDGGDSGLFYLHFYPNGIIGKATVKVMLFPDGNRSDNLIATFVAEVLPVSIEEKTNSFFILAFPSPANDIVTISFENAWHLPFDLFITDISGKMVIESYNNHEDFFRADIKNLPSGTYFYKVESLNRKYRSSGKFLKY